MVIWLDFHIGLDENCKALKSDFRRLTNCFRVESTVEGCRSILPHVKDRKVFFIIQGCLAKSIVPDIERIIPEDAEPVVYIFCRDIAEHRDFGLEHPSIIDRGDICDHGKDLLGRLTNDLNEYAFKKLANYGLEPTVVKFTREIGDTIEHGCRMFNMSAVSKQTSITAS